MDHLYQQKYHPFYLNASYGFVNVIFNRIFAEKICQNLKWCIGILVWMGIILFSLQTTVFAELKPMKAHELKRATGTGAVDFSIIGNTARIFFDQHIETYMEIDSFKAGYYGRSDFTTTKYNYVTSEGEVNDNYYSMRLFNEPNPDFPGVTELTGTQGTGQNTNTHDWDMNMENIRIGDAENAAVIDGMVFIVEFDDIKSSNKKLQRVIFGTNSLQGNVSANVNRATGMFNPSLANNDAIQYVQNQLGQTLNPILLKRDSFLTNFNDEGYTFEGDHTGFFTCLSFSEQHKGVEMVWGYDESALTFDYKAEWWD